MSARTYYLHTLDGRPAAFFPGDGICFMNFYGKANPLCRSLKEIRQQQKESERIRCDCPDGAQLGYRRVSLP